MQCKNAAAAQVWYESGQFIKTIQLNGNGQVASLKNPSVDCVVAIVGAVAVVFRPPVVRSRGAGAPSLRP